MEEYDHRVDIEKGMNRVYERGITSLLEGKHIAILVEKDFEDSQFIELFHTLKDAGAGMTIVGSLKKGILGYAR